VNGKVAVDKKAEEYEAIYEHFARLLTAGESYIDAAPFELVADAFMVGKRREVEAFKE
jgi:D-galactose 1-dehydrogenase